MAAIIPVTFNALCFFFWGRTIGANSDSSIGTYVIFFGLADLEGLADFEGRADF